MRKVRCYECGRSYDFDVDDFCPRCGAFNQPGKQTSIGADGSVVRSDGLNEKNHAGSFVHREFHSENRSRRASGLSKGVRRAAAPVGGQQREKQKRNPFQTLIWVIIAIIFINILSTVLGALFL